MIVDAKGASGTSPEYEYFMFPSTRFAKLVAHWCSEVLPAQTLAKFTNPAGCEVSPTDTSADVVQ